jgi:hypothetical protein
MCPSLDSFLEFHCGYGATVPNRSVDPKCIPMHVIPDAAQCESSVHDVLTPQQFQDSITTAPPTTQADSAQKSHKERQV